MNPVQEKDLPVELSAFQAVEAAYPASLQRCREALGQGLPVMVECDKELTPYFYKCLRDRLRGDGRRCVYLDGRPDPGSHETAVPAQVGMMGAMMWVMTEFFFSGYGVPVENMPLILQKIALVFPIYHYMIIFRAVLLKGVGLAVIWPQILAGLAIGAVVIPVAIWFLGRQKWE